jgi:hypothetical protein
MNSYPYAIFKIKKKLFAFLNDLASKYGLHSIQLPLDCCEPLGSHSNLTFDYFIFKIGTEVEYPLFKMLRNRNGFLLFFN